MFFTGNLCEVDIVVPYAVSHAVHIANVMSSVDNCVKIVDKRQSCCWKEMAAIYFLGEYKIFKRCTDIFGKLL